MQGPVADGLTHHLFHPKHTQVQGAVRPHVAHLRPVSRRGYSEPSIPSNSLPVLTRTPTPPHPQNRCARLGLICQEQTHGPGRPLGPGSLAFVRPRDETSIQDLLLARAEEKQQHSPSSSAAAADAASSPAGAATGGSGGEEERRAGKRHRGLVAPGGAGAAYEPKRCAEVVAAKYAQLAAEDGVRVDKALATL